MSEKQERKLTQKRDPSPWEIQQCSHFMVDVGDCEETQVQGAAPPCLRFIKGTTGSTVR